MDTPAPRASWYQELVIRFPDGAREAFFIERSRSGTHRPTKRAQPAPWTLLEHHKCPGCPLAAPDRFCPAALSLEQTLDKLAGRISYEEVQASAVDGDERTFRVTWPLQKVGAVFVQLAVFASGCPVGMRYKPLLAGLQPFATNEELGKHLVAGLLKRHRGAVEECRKELETAMETLRTVLLHLCKRLAQDRALDGDAVPNAIVTVDAFAAWISMQAEHLIQGICGNRK
ncbi:MAG: hypothetical protein HY553_21920 [Elusimicrobia bacterium]|nr:hypothetical protein [Elusimicrobiota bacterium]